MIAIGVSELCILWDKPCKLSLCNANYNSKRLILQSPPPFNFSERRWITQAQKMIHGLVTSTKRPPAAVAVKTTLEELCSQMAMPILLDIL
jgi:hypothetical protein